MDAEVNRAGPGDGREERGRRALQRLRAVTVLFDQAFAIPGTKWRFGIDALFGLVPGLGDIAGAIVAVYALHVARALGAPQAVQVRMLGNIALDALVGTVPIVGDLFDFAFKAQTRNLVLLDAYLAKPQLTGRRSQRGLILISIAILIVFATLTALGIWMVYILLRWLGTFLAGF